MQKISESAAGTKETINTFSSGIQAPNIKRSMTCNVQISNKRERLSVVFSYSFYFSSVYILVLSLVSVNYHRAKNIYYL